MERKIIVLVLLLPVLCLIEPALADNQVIISSPQSGAEVGGRVVVKGRCTIEDGSRLWVFAHMKQLEGQWWPQNQPVVDRNGNWQVLIHLGVPVDVGREFEITAATFDPNVDARIRRYHQDSQSAQQWLPIKFPKATSARTTIVVQKVRP
jgi:hypothetical protein